MSVEHLLTLEPATKHQTASELLRDAQHQCPEDFRDTVRQYQLHQENGNDTAKRHNAQRFVRFNDGPDGMIKLNGLLPAVEGASFKASLAAMVDAKWLAEHPQRAKVEGGHGGDSHEQRMADALISLTNGGLIANVPVKTPAPPTTKSAHNPADGPTSTPKTNATYDTPTGDSSTTDSPQWSGTAMDNRPSNTDYLSDENDTVIRESDPVETIQKLITPLKVKPSVVINVNIDKWEAEILGTGPIPITPSLFDLAKNDLYYAYKNTTGEVLETRTLPVTIPPPRNG